MGDKLQCFSCAFRDNANDGAWRHDRCVIYNDRKPSKIFSGEKECACYSKDNGKDRN